MSTISTADLTQQDLEGTGVFDILMDATKQHIKAEFDANRVTGADYAQLYSTAITNVLQQSIAFLLNKEINDKQADLLASQISKMVKDEDLVDQQILQSIQQTELLEAQVSLAYAQIQDSVNIKDVSTNVTGLVSRQKLQTEAETSLVGTQKNVALAQILDNVTSTPGVVTGSIGAQTAAVNAQKANVVSENANIGKVGLKVDAEKALLIQKTVSELAQTEDDATGTSSANEGLIGRQKLLFAAQTAGFARDAEQKFAKIASDIWAVAKTVEGVGYSYPDNWTDVDIADILDKAAAGIGVTT
jgi:hypothetical protein